MALTKFKAWIGLVLGITLFGIGGVTLGTRYLPARQGQAAQAAPNADDQKPAQSKNRTETTDAEKLSGAWKGSSGQRDGQELPADAVKNYRYVFGAGKVTLQFGKESMEGTFKLDPTAKPKTIDLVFKDSTGLGIYTLDGDTLKICLTEGGKENRPVDFTAKKGGRAVLLVLKREGGRDR